MIVVDTNVIAYLWIPGVHTSLAEYLLALEPEWSAPLLWRSELRNVLTGCVRRRSMTISSAARVMDEAEAHMRGREYSVPSTDVLERAHTSHCSAYDCEFIVLAEALSCPLVTSDRQLQAAFPSRAQALGQFVGRRTL